MHKSPIPITNEKNGTGTVGGIDGPAKGEAYLFVHGEGESKVARRLRRRQQERQRFRVHHVASMAPCGQYDTMRAKYDMRAKYALVELVHI
jgi:hypothetical protein